jgi:hypothetical protein
MNKNSKMKIKSWLCNAFGVQGLEGSYSVGVCGSLKQLIKVINDV